MYYTVSTLNSSCTGVQLPFLVCVHTWPMILSNIFLRSLCCFVSTSCHVSAVDEEEHSHAVCPWRWRGTSCSTAESRLSSNRMTLWTVNCNGYWLFFVCLFNSIIVKFCTFFFFLVEVSQKLICVSWWLDWIF